MFAHFVDSKLLQLAAWPLHVACVQQRHQPTVEGQAAGLPMGVCVQLGTNDEGGLQANPDTSGTVQLSLQTHHVMGPSSMVTTRCALYSDQVDTGEWLGLLQQLAMPQRHYWVHN